MKKTVKRGDVGGKGGARESAAAFRSTFPNRLVAILDVFETRAAAALVAGVGPDQLTKYVAETAKMPLPVAARLCEAQGFSLDWLMWGTGSQKRDGDDDVLVMVPVWNVSASSGPGTFVISEELQGDLAFSRAWLRTLNIPLNDLHVVFNSGNSNMPVINDSDAMLVQRGIERLVGDAFYVLDSDGVLLVKEIERRADGSVVLRSRNPDHAPQVIARGEVSSLTVFGRVVWAGGLV